jgi:FKBP-type peptidyl-prolyl cis-trans isomerase FkpA
MKSEKGCEPLKPSSEEAQILSYASANNLDVVKDPTGIYYQVIDAGVGPSPTVEDTVTVTYTGKFLNGSEFDKSTNPVTFPLRGVIEGWQIVIPKLKKGGRIKMLLPSAYAYGCMGYAPRIPANEILFFDVTLVDIK